jgi:hypothetical protein
MANLNKSISETAVRLGEVRFSYCNVFAPRRNPDGTQGKYSVCVIIPKSNTEAVALFKSAYEAARAAGKTTKWGGKIPAKVTMPLHDGDEERPDDPAFEGCWYFNCSSNNAPGVRVKDELGQIVEALDDSDFYSGAYGAVTVNLFPYASNGNSGVGIGLNNLIKLRDGERLSGGRSADADFSDLE